MLNPKNYRFDFDLIAPGPIYRVKQAVRQALWSDSECPIALSERWAGDAAIVSFKQAPQSKTTSDLTYSYEGEVTFVDEGTDIRLYVSIDVDLTRVNLLEQIRLRLGLPKVFKKRFANASQLEGIG